MSQTDRPVQINISGIPVAGIGGLGLVAMAALVSYVMPAAWWTMVAGISGSLILAVALLLFRRGRKVQGPSGDDPTILFREIPPADVQSGGRQPTDSETRDSPIRRLGDSPIYSTR